MITPTFLLDYSKIFDGEPEVFSAYLEGIGIEFISLFCSHFISVDKNQPEYSNPEILVNDWFSDNNQEIRTFIIEKIRELSAEYNKPVQIIQEFNIYKLFEYTLNNLPESSELNNEELEINLFKCVLSLNTEFNNRDVSLNNSISNLDKNDEHPALLMTASFMYYDLVDYHVSDKVLTQFLKSSLLFKFLEEYDNTTSELLSKLISNYRVNSWKDFLKKYLPLAHGLIKHKNKHTDVIVPKDNNFDEKIKFLNNISVNNEVTLNELDFITLRSKPFFKVDENKYRIISPLFTCEKIYEGLYFIINKINNEAKLQEEKYIKGDFRGFYCSEFSEKYLLYQILNKSFPKKFVKLSGKDFRAQNISGEPDYYVRNGNKIFLFESKDVLINAKHKQSNDFVKIEAALKSKFYYYEQNNIKHYVGICQIINNIRRILEKESDFDTINRETARIYPILVTYHNVFNTPGINYFINKWFMHELKKENVDKDKVNQPIIIDIDTFILYHEFFCSRKVIFEHLLDQYISKTQINDSIFSTRSIEDRLNDSCVSFTKFADNEIRRKNLKYEQPQLFKDLALGLFE